MPFFAELTASADVGLREDASVLRPKHRQRRVSWRQVDVESAVSRQVNRIISLEFDSSLVNQEHRDPGFVLGLVPHLLDFDLAGWNWRFDLRPHLLLSGRDLVTVNSWRLRERLELVESFVAVPSPSHWAGASNHRKLDLPNMLSSDVQYFNLGAGVVQIGY